MKTTLHLDTLRLTVRGVPAATAGAALQGLGPVLAQELRTARNAAAPESPAALRVSSTVGAPALRRALAARIAGTLQPHLRTHA